MSNQDSGTTPSDATRAAEEAEAATSHQADRPPTADESNSAPTQADGETVEDYKEMAEKGADVKGEGELP